MGLIAPLLSLIRKPAYGFRGEYSSFEEAAATCAGYDRAEIGERVARSLAPYISSTPPEIEPHVRQLHAAFRTIINHAGKRLSVLDVGGANGAYYFMLQRLLSAAAIEWTVLETPNVAKACRSLGSLPLSFIEELQPGQHYDVALLSGSLQYLSNPYAAFRKVCPLAKWIIISRLPLTSRAADQIKVQFSPPDVAVPIWILGRRFEELIRGTGKIVMEWEVELDRDLNARIEARAAGFLIQVR